MTGRKVVVVQRRSSLPGLVFGWAVLITLAVGFIGAFFAWPVSIWHGFAGALAESLWLFFLAVVGVLAFRSFARRERARTAEPRGRHAAEVPRHARPAHPAIKAEPGPRDYTVPWDSAAERWEK